MINLKNKKADERYLSIWMFIIWIIIAVGLVWGVTLFFSGSADVRKTEADILNQRILDCLGTDFDASQFNPDFDLFSKCSLNKAVLADSDFYYINLTIYSYTGEKVLDSYNSGDAVKSLAYNKTYGVGYFEKDCIVQFNKNKDEPNFAQCYSNKILILNPLNKNQLYEVNVLTASNQNDIQK